MSFLELVSFMKKHHESGIWLEQGKIRVHSDAGNRNSSCYQIQPAVFKFLYEKKFIEKNVYNGEERLRVFPKTKKLDDASLDRLEKEFLVFKCSLSHEEQCGPIPFVIF